MKIAGKWMAHWNGPDDRPYCALLPNSVPTQCTEAHVPGPDARAARSLGRSGLRLSRIFAFLALLLAGCRYGGDGHATGNPARDVMPVEPARRALDPQRQFAALKEVRARLELARSEYQRLNALAEDSMAAPTDKEDALAAVRKAQDVFAAQRMSLATTGRK